MNPNIYIVSEETPCPLRDYERHITEQIFFRNAGIAFDYYKSRLDSMTSGKEYTYVFGAPAFRTLKDRFLLCEGSQECHLYSRMRGNVFVCLRKAEILTSVS